MKVKDFLVNKGVKGYKLELRKDELVNLLNEFGRIKWMEAQHDAYIKNVNYIQNKKVLGCEVKKYPPLGRFTAYKKD